MCIKQRIISHSDIKSLCIQIFVCTGFKKFIYSFVYLFFQAAFPSRFFIRTFLVVLYFCLMNPSRRRKHRKAYFSFSTSFSFAVMLAVSGHIHQCADKLHEGFCLAILPGQCKPWESDALRINIVEKVVSAECLAEQVAFCFNSYRLFW